VAEGTRQDDAKLTYDMVTGVHFAEVEVDTRSGKVRVLRVLAIHDAGRILNLLTAESQVMGGVIQGMHYALFEERVMDRNLGKMLNSNLESYKIGGSKDMPQIEVDVQDISMGGTYVGALGLGECPVIPTAAAIGNAVYHAIGARVRSIPMTPARVLEALGTVQAARSTRRKAKGGKR
jgi:xanthine dehydrogenase YagR molybdenum-binding subunit